MSDQLFLNIILLPLAIVVCMHLWFDEIFKIIYSITFYFRLSFATVLWICHFGQITITTYKYDFEKKEYVEVTLHQIE
jgi:hypothetical protein